MTRRKASTMMKSSVNPFLHFLSLSALLHHPGPNPDPDLSCPSPPPFPSLPPPTPQHHPPGSDGTGLPELWQQPEGEGYRPCLEFGVGHRKVSARFSNEKRRFLCWVPPSWRPKYFGPILWSNSECFIQIKKKKHFLSRLGEKGREKKRRRVFRNSWYQLQKK